MKLIFAATGNAFPTQSIQVQRVTFPLRHSRTPSTLFLVFPSQFSPFRHLAWWMPAALTHFSFRAPDNFPQTGRAA